MAEAPILTYLASAGSYCNTEIAGTLTAQGYYSFPLRAGHPLTPAFQKAILANTESLATSKIVDAALGGSGGGCSAPGSGGSGAQRIDLNTMGGIFFSAIMLVVLSWVLLLAECAVWRARDRPGKHWRALFKFCGGHDYIGAYNAEDREVEEAYQQHKGGARALGSSSSSASSGSVNDGEEVAEHTSNPLKGLSERGSSGRGML
jgi:hypothetical protein